MSLKGSNFAVPSYYLRLALHLCILADAMLPIESRAERRSRLAGPFVQAIPQPHSPVSWREAG